jgi:acyl-CoA thioester hydrolase
LPFSGFFDGNDHLFAVRIYYEDTDFSGVVYHANYLRYMERARSDMLSVLGIDQRASYQAGEGYYAVADMQIRFHAPAHFDDALVIVSRVKGLRAAAVIIEQTVMRGSDIIAAATVQAAFLTANGRPRRQPQAWTAAYRAVMDDKT